MKKYFNFSALLIPIPRNIPVEQFIKIAEKIKITRKMLSKFISISLIIKKEEKREEKPSPREAPYMGTPSSYKAPILRTTNLASCSIKEKRKEKRSRL